MAATLDEVLTLAKSTHALSQEQLSRILALAPTMGEADLEKMKSMLMGVQEAEEKDMKAELEMRKKVASLRQQWQAGKDRTALQMQESAVSKEDQAQAEALIQNI